VCVYIYICVCVCVCVCVCLRVYLLTYVTSLCSGTQSTTHNYWYLIPYLGSPTSLCTLIYRVSQEECARLREHVPYVKVHRYNTKHLYPKLNGYGIMVREKCGLPAVPRTVPVQLTRFLYTVHVRP
jgi:hypothetical protein